MWPQLSLEEASLSADKEMLTTLPDAVVVVSPGHPRKRRSRVLLTSARSLLAPGALLVALLVAWEIWVRIGNVPRYLAVAPSEVARFIVDNWGSLYHDVVVTNMEALYGLLAGTGIGMLLAILIVHSRILSKTLMPLIIGSQVVPKVAIAPLLLLWLGFGTLPKVIVASLMSFFPVVVSHAFGLQSVPEEILDLGRSMHAGRLRIFYKIRMPYSLPALFSGLKVASSLAIIGAVVGEFLGASHGLGYRITLAKYNLDTTTVFASLVLLVFIGVVFYVGVILLQRILVPWAAHAQRGA